MFRINEHKLSVGGFTLVELLVAMSLMVTLAAAVLAAYLFLGRNLTRLVNYEQQERKARFAFRMFSQDLGAASNLTAASSTISSGTTTAAHFEVSVPTSADGSTSKTVVYDYSSATGKFTRQDGAQAAQNMLTDITSFSVNYFTVSQTLNGVAYDTALAAPSSPLGVKAVEFRFSTSVGSSAAGTLATYKAMSPRVLLRSRSGLLK